MPALRSNWYINIYTKHYINTTIILCNSSTGQKKIILPEYVSVLYGVVYVINTTAVHYAYICHGRLATFYTLVINIANSVSRLIQVDS